MARQGRAGPALGIAAIGSFIAGTLAIVGLMLVAPTLARFAVKFGPAEYFSLMVLGLSILTYLSHGSLLKALIMACFGLMLGLIGLDSISAVARLTFDRMELVDGVGLVPIVMGLFGIAEILVNIEQKLTREMFTERITGLLPSRQDWAESAGAAGARLGAGLRARHPAGRRRRDRLVPVLRAGEARLAGRRRNSARARSPASRGRKPPTTPRPAAASFRC